MFEGFERRIVSVDGIDIACVVGGSGPPVLMLHGFPQNRAMWARVAPGWRNTTRSYAQISAATAIPAKPKCLPDRSNYAFRAMAADQLGLMRALGLSASM